MAKHSPSLALTLNPLAKDKNPIIDLRPASEFIAGHLPYSASLPLADLEDSWHELPPKKTPLTVVANQKDLPYLKELFALQDYPIVEILSEEDLSNSKLQVGNLSQRLWRANPLLENYIQQIKTHLSKEGAKVFDIGSGSGRDSLFLRLHGLHAVAIDNNRFALERLGHFSERWNLPVTAKNLDLQNQALELEQLILEQKPQLIVQARYLHRPLLDIYKRSLAPGAMLAIHTFTEKAAEFGKPKNPAYLLRDGELEETFAGWQLLVNEEHRLADGRPLSMFLARKR